MTAQLPLFEAPTPALPEGFRYRNEVLSVTEESALIGEMPGLPFTDFEYQGYKGKRRVVSFGWRYDFNTRKLSKAEDIPDFLLSLRETAGRFAAIEAVRFQQVLVTEYAPGAGIGWHKDRPVFGEVAGFSLAAPCTFRLRLKEGTRWRRMSLEALPRSAYLMTGPSRWEWEHSITPVDALRYSITFRNFWEF